MKKGIKFISIVILLCAFYMIFLLFFGHQQNVGDEPVITAPDSVLKASVKVNDKTLLKGVKATDTEDGDLTKDVYIENISSFDDNQTRTITYAVFDSDDHIVRTTRKLEYTDYQAPEINIKKALCYYYVTSIEEYKDYVSASSSVDGDISAQISVERETYEGDGHYVLFSVTDSCGTKTSLKLKADELKNDPNIDIKLDQYLMRVPVGTIVNPKRHIEEIETMGMIDNSLKSLIEITNNYNSEVPGTYEFVYRISRANGDFGMTKLVVIVE